MANLRAVLASSEHWKRAAELKQSLEESKFAALPLAFLPTVFPQGLSRGSLAEIYGSRSSGRTSLCLHILAEATGRGEVCAVVDLFDSFHPASAAAAGVELDRLVWVRCKGNAEAALRAVDLLLHAGGFGVVLLDLCEASPRMLNRIPLSYWHRFRRVVENTPTVLLVCAESRQAKSCAGSSLQTKSKAFSWSGMKPFCLLKGLEAQATLDRISAIRPHPLFLKAVC